MSAWTRIVSSCLSSSDGLCPKNRVMGGTCDVFLIQVRPSEKLFPAISTVRTETVAWLLLVSSLQSSNEKTPQASSTRYSSSAN